MLICVSVVCPVALFKLLAFVDPGTASGASMRAGIQTMGGMQGLLHGHPVAGTAGEAASQSSGSPSAGEASADAATTARVTSVAQQASGFLGPVGAGLAAGIGVMTKVGSMGTSVLTDMTNQEGVGHNTYQPDFQSGFDDGAARANREANANPEDRIPARPHQPAATRPARTRSAPPAGQRLPGRWAFGDRSGYSGRLGLFPAVPPELAVRVVRPRPTWPWWRCSDE